MGYLYISYSRQNAEFAQRLVNELETRGYTTWVDTDDLATGDMWARQIAQAIREAEVFITLLSPATVSNRTVHREIELAEAARKPIIPVLVESTPIPSSLINRQLVDATGDWNVFITELIRAIDASAASVPMRKIRISAAAAAPTPPAGIPAVPPASRRAGIGRPLLLIGLLGLLGLIAAALVLLVIQPGRAPTANNAAATMTLAPTGTVLAIEPTANPEVIATPADQIEAAQMTATALIARATQQAAGVFTQVAIAPSDAGDDRLEAEIAMRVDATIAAINTVEASSFPAAAQVLAVSSTTNTLAYLTGILAALALGVSIAALVVIRSYNNRPLPRRTAHSTAHSGSSPAHPEAAPPEKMLEDYQIFTSSSDKDRDWVRILVEDLEALGYSVWWYAKDAPGL
ncbi:MAG TPA: toll/interleukin-1 receptor domain-containing protein, partial [Spirillospora sp.]|nr:toll/interleukin-1 receptor domain-containing protein [Spirillospora sp.]